MKVSYSIFCEVELDTETGKSRILRHFASPVGKNTKAPKKIVPISTVSSGGIEEV
jgi:hypothetical protein